jgi:hypothetical protein
MPLRFVDSGALSAAQQVRPMTQAAADLGEMAGHNSHLYGTAYMPGASQQMAPLQRAIDPSDLEAQHGGQLSGQYATPVVNQMATQTVVADTPSQQLGRALHMDTNRVAEQQENEVQRATTFQSEVIPAQLQQRNADQMRAMAVSQDNALYRDGTGDIADIQSAQARQFAHKATLGMLDPRQLQTLDAAYPTVTAMGG